MFLLSLLDVLPLRLPLPFVRSVSFLQLWFTRPGAGIETLIDRQRFLWVYYGKHEEPENREVHG